MAFYNHIENSVSQITVFTKLSLNFVFKKDKLKNKLKKERKKYYGRM